MKERWVKYVLIAVVVLLAVGGMYLAYSSVTTVMRAREVIGLESADATGDSEEKQTLKVTFISMQTSWAASVSNMIFAFENEYPQYDVEFDIYNESEFYEDTLNELYARGELGDVVEMPTPEYYAAEGILYPLSEELTSLTGITSKYDGEPYGVATVAYTTGIIYNKEIFERYGLEEPQTYDELLELCKKLKRHGITPISTAGANKWAFSMLLDHYFHTDVLQNNRQWLNKINSGMSYWTDDDVLSMLEDLSELGSYGYLDSLWESTTNESIGEFLVNGDIAMTYAASWMINDISTLSGEDKVGWFYLKDDDGSLVLDKQTKSYWTITDECGQDPDKLEAAETFIKYFYTEDVYENVCESVTGFSVSAKYVELDYSGIQAEIIEGAKEADRTCRLTLSSALIPQDFRRKLYDEIYAVINGEETPSLASKRLQRAWERMTITEESE